MKRKLLKSLLAIAVLCVGVGNVWAQDPTPVYFNDFSSTEGLTIQGTGSFTDDGDTRFGQVFSNAASALPRSNYLLLPSTVFSDFTDDGGKTAMTISFWVTAKNAGAANAYTYAPLFAAYSAAPNPTNGLPMICLPSRGTMQINNNGWCDFAPAQNKDGKNTIYNTNAWEVDGSHTSEYTSGGNWLDDSNWHLYTMTLTASQATIYLDGVLKNQWNLDGSDGQYVSGMFTKSATNLTYVCLGGNQAWDWGDNDAAFMFDDFAVYDVALTPAQIAKVIEDKLGYTTVTYDFTSYSARTLSNSGTRAFNANSVNHNYPSNLPEAFDRFSFQFAGTFSIEAAGLYAQRTNGDHVGIVGLSANDKVTINFSQGDIMVRGAVPTWAGITNAWTGYTSGTEITASVAGNLSFQAKTSCKISSIVIKTLTTETMTAPSISSVAGTVTITSGASNLKSGVTTYYTTDGSTPTASSTVYTEPFVVDETCTVNAITISNSSAATASSISSQLIDLDVVEVPTATITAVDGINRTVSFACATDGATLSYSTDNGETYTAGTSLVISENTYIKVKATKGSSTESENMLFEAGTTITLNAPTYTIGAYSEGSYTLVLNTNQSDKLLSPVATITYSIDGGASTNVASGSNVVVPVGSTLEAWSVAAGYGNSDVSSVTPSYIDLAEYQLSWSTDFKAVANSLEAGAGGKVLARGESLIDGYVHIADEGFNSNFGVNDDSWQVRYYGAGKEYNSGLWPYNLNGAAMAITNLPAGSVVVFTANGAINAKTNAVKDDFVSLANSNYTFTIPATGSAEFYATKSSYIYSVAVYVPVVPVTLGSLGWATLYTPYALNFDGTGLTAYTATVAGSTVTLAPVTDVPANTGVVLQGDAGTYDIPVITSSSTDQGSLTGNAAAATAYDAFDGYTLYALAQAEDYPTHQVQFRPVSSGSIAAGKAFLKIASGAGIKAFTVNFGDAVAISDVSSKMEDTQSEIFNLAGQRMSKVQKGVNIVNGKKVLVK
ncbi:MAG: hypothetical protein E7105_04875 [Prevotella sp.]|nr:hypothetical protein [Prevotella sp.]